MHGANAAHAAVAFVAAALVQDDLARGLFCARKHAAHHDRAGPSRNRFCDVAAVANSAIANQWHAGAAQGCSHIVDGHDLRHAHARHDSGGANAAGANADLDAVCTGFNQCQRSCAGSNVATNDVNVRVVSFDPTHAFDHALAVTMRGIDHDGVNAGPHQGFDALFSARPHANRCTHTQATGGVASGVWKIGLLGDVLDGDQTLEFKVVVDHQQTLKLVFIKQGLGFERRSAFLDGDELFTRRHDLVCLDVVTGLKAQITAGHDTHDLAAVTDWKTRDSELLGQFQNLQHRVLRGDNHRIADDARLVALDLGHMRGLLLSCQVLVYDADAALLRNSNRQSRLGHGVHSGGHERQIQANIARKLGGKCGVLGKDLGERWHQQYVVEGERFAE